MKSTINPSISLFSILAISTFFAHTAAAIDDSINTNIAPTPEMHLTYEPYGTDESGSFVSFDASDINYDSTPSADALEPTFSLTDEGDETQVGETLGEEEQDRGEFIFEVLSRFPYNLFARSIFPRGSNHHNTGDGDTVSMIFRGENMLNTVFYGLNSELNGEEAVRRIRCISDSHILAYESDVDLNGVRVPEASNRGLSIYECGMRENITYPIDGNRVDWIRYPELQLSSRDISVSGEIPLIVNFLTGLPNYTSKQAPIAQEIQRQSRHSIVCDTCYKLSLLANITINISARSR